MPNYEALHTEYIPTANILMRLSKDDTQFLATRIKQAVEEGTGVSLVFIEWRGAISLTNSPERGEQVKCIAYNHSPGRTRVETEMLGYNGQWSHVELVYPKTSLSVFKRFLQAMAKRMGRQPRLMS